MPRIPALGFLFCATLALAAPASSGPVLPRTFAGWNSNRCPRSPHSSPADRPFSRNTASPDRSSAGYRLGRASPHRPCLAIPGCHRRLSAPSPSSAQPEMHADECRSPAAPLPAITISSGPAATVVDATFAHPVPKEDAILSALAAESAQSWRHPGRAALTPQLPAESATQRRHACTTSSARPRGAQLGSADSRQRHRFQPGC